MGTIRGVQFQAGAIYMWVYIYMDINSSAMHHTHNVGGIRPK